MAAALRHLVTLLAAIASSRFAPDEYRSGRFLDRPAFPPPVSSPSDSSSSSDVAQASQDSGEEFQPVFDNIVRNLATGTVHILDDGGYKLKCGKELPKNHERLTYLPPEPRLCSRCF